MLINDIVRLILLETHLSTIHTFLTTTRLQLPDAWWRNYLLKKIPLKCHFLLNGIADVKKFMREEGIHILRRVEEGDGRYFELEAKFHQMDLGDILQSRSIVFHNALEHKEIRVRADQSEPVKCYIAFNETYMETEFGYGSYTLEVEPILVTDLPTFIHGVLLFSGNNNSRFLTERVHNAKLVTRSFDTTYL